MAVGQDAASEYIALRVFNLPPIRKVGRLAVIVVQERDVEAEATIPERFQLNRQYIRFTKVEFTEVRFGRRGGSGWFCWAWERRCRFLCILQCRTAGGDQTDGD